jgi:colanic acid/amylovoran biosynthesis glycosyltransferase
MYILKKSILFKIQQFPHLSETFILDQIILAIEAGYKVRVIVKDVLDFEKSTHLKKIKKYGIDEKIIVENYKIPTNKFIRFFKAGIIVLKFFRKLNRIWKYQRLKTKFSLTWIYEFAFYNQFNTTDIIHVQYGTNVHPVDLLKHIGLLKGRMIVSFHGHDAFFPINGFIQNNGYYDYLFRGDNLIVANTPYLAEKIEQLGCEKKNLAIIPVPINTKFFTPAKFIKENKSLQLINVGRLDPIKGQSVALDFISMILKNNIEVHLIIIGEGREYLKLKRKIFELSLEKNVTLIGRKNQKEVRELLRNSDIYLFTGMPVEEGRRETQGLATLEAQACGLPVLAFDSGGVKYTVERNETGFLCKENDLHCLLEKFYFLRDNNLRLQMGQNARVFTEKEFSKNVIKKKWKEIYDASV